MPSPPPFRRNLPQARVEPDTVSVIIPNWNGAPYLSACISALAAQDIAPRRLEIVLIDNASTDDSAAIVAQQFPAVRLIRNSRNVGFTPAINQGIEAARGDLLLLLNNDTEMQPGALAELLKALDDGPPELGGVQPLLLRASDPLLIDSAGIALEPHFRARDDLHGQPRTLAPASPAEIWGLCAGCALIRRAVFAACGGFDPDYFAEWDDVDFSLRAHWCGFRFLLVPAATVLHHRSPSSNRAPIAKIARHRRNQLFTMLKDLPDGMRARVLAYRFLRDLSMLPHYLRQHELRAMLGVWREAWAMRPVMRGRRAELLRHANRTHRQMRAELSTFMRQGAAR
jgi:GT2 family glycosyltransferase